MMSKLTVLRQDELLPRRLPGFIMMLAMLPRVVEFDTGVGAGGGGGGGAATYGGGIGGGGADGRRSSSLLRVV